MNKFYGIIIGVFSYCILQVNVFANVDQTSMVTYTYDCSTASGGTLHAIFSLGSHHLYYRHYNINLPGVIEIADANHTSLAKSKNLSIDGCDIPVGSCTISSTGTWLHKSDADVISLTLNITTDLPIVQSGDIISIDGSGINSGETLQIDDGSSLYDFAGQVVSIDMQNDKVIMQNDSNTQTLISFTNTVYDGQDEYEYLVSSDKKDIALIKKRFQRTKTGTQMSSANPWDEFESGTGGNWASPSSDPDWVSTLSGAKNARGPGYVTGLNYWQHTQPNYTTTKVKVYPVSLTCTQIEDSNGTSSSMPLSFNGTLGGTIQSVFSGNTMIVNLGAAESMFASGSVNITGVKYQTVGEVAGIKDKVNEVRLSFRERYSAETKWVSKVVIPAISTPGVFPPLSFQIKEKTATCEIGVEMGCTAPALVPAGEYVFLIQFFDTGSRIGDLQVPVFEIKPNNTYTKSGSLVVTTTGSGYANNSDSYTLCQDYHDSYANSYTNSGNITTNLSGTGWYLDQISHIGEGVTIFDSIFRDSKLCFSARSLSPGSKTVTFASRLPVYSINNTILGLTSPIYSSHTLIFEKPLTALLKASNSLAEDYTGAPQVGTMQKYLLALTNSGNLLGFTNGIINISPSAIINTQTGHIFEEFTSDNEFGNSTTDYVGFTTRINATGGFLSVPKLTSTGLWVSYTLSGYTIRYLINGYSDPMNTSVVSSTGISIDASLGVKIIGNSQLSGKAEITGQRSNLSAVSTVDQRNEMRKNASILTRNMDSGQVVNGVKYIEGSGSVILSGEQIFETLVVRDGNVIINGDINPSGKKLGIIVLSGDVYPGNVYVVPTVQYINALIYADGGFISVKSSSDLASFNTDSAERTNTLNRQLVLKGLLFTRNTIGGSIDPDTSGNYKLPGDALTTDFNEAMIYDLDQVRRSNQGWDTQINRNQNNDDYFVIIYDTKYLQAPPAGFSTQL